MACTTILVGKKASYDGSTIIARTEDSQSGDFTPKQFIVVKPEDQPRHYKSVLSSFEMDLPDNPMRYTSVPDALRKDGIWGEAGINEANVAMSETETITTNARVLGADPLVESGIGEEDMLTLVLPYVRTAREGVERLGAILEQYGTYESNGVAFSDVNEIWWLETIGGHHWIARRVPDDCYVTNPNQLGIDHFEFNNPDEYMYSKDLRDFIASNNLDLTYSNEHFNPRYAFGSQRDKDRHYNTPRAWAMQRFLNPEIEQDPRSFFIPWAQKPYRKITIEDVKYVLSNHYQDTEFDPYGPEGNAVTQRAFRTIGINRTSQTAILQLRPDQPHDTWEFNGWHTVQCHLEQWCHSLLKFQRHQPILPILAKMFQQTHSIGQIVLLQQLLTHISTNMKVILKIISKKQWQQDMHESNVSMPL